VTVLGETSDFLVTGFDGASMLPVVRPGDRILWRRVRMGRVPASGAVVGRLRGAKLIAHRLVGRCAPGWVITQGDACPSADPPAEESAIAWVAVAAWREGRPICLDRPSRPTRLAFRFRAVARSLARSAILRARAWAIAGRGTRSR